MKRKERIVAVIFTAILLFFPLGTLVQKQVQTLRSNQHRKQIYEEESETETGAGYENAVYEQETDESGNFLQKIIDEGDSFSSDLIFSEFIAKANTYLTGLLSGGSYVDSGQVIRGKEGWLFYKRESDGSSLADYQGTSRFTQKELEEIKNNLLYTRKVLEEQDIRFVVLLIPNKEIIYSEYMPDTIYRSSEITRCDLLYQYLTENTDLEIVYPKEELLAAKSTAQLYYKYDTHWNNAGMYVGVQCLLQQLYGTFSPLTEENVVPVSYNMSGDLAKLLGEQNKLCDDADYEFNCLPGDQAVTDSVLVCGDSFGDILTPGLSFYFLGGARMQSLYGFSMDQISGDDKPDVLVLECVERYADRLLKIDLTE